MREVSILWADDKEEVFISCSKHLEYFFKEKNVDIRIAFTWAVDGNAVYRPLLNNIKFDIIVLDIEMEYWGGIETVKDLAKKYPGLPMIMVSNYLLEYAQTLSNLVEQKIIQGYYSVEPRQNWCQAIWEIINTKAPILMHISDIHFGSDHGFTEKLPIKEALNPILEDIKDKIDLLVVSGDLSSKGLEGEFSLAEEFLFMLAQKLNISLDKIIIVPGNHDIYRLEQQNSRFKKFIEFLNNFYKKENVPTTVLQRYPELYDETQKELRWKNNKHTEDSLYNIAIYDEFKTIVIGLNSVIQSDAKWDLSEISPVQLSKISQRIKSLRSPRSDYFRIATFHHQLFVVPSIFKEGEPERVIRNQALVLRTLISNQIKLVLHGHTHYSVGYTHIPHFLMDDSKPTIPIHVFATGTLSGKELEPAQPYFSFNIIDCNLNTEGKISTGMVTPYQLTQDELGWKKRSPVNIKF